MIQLPSIAFQIEGQRIDALHFDNHSQCIDIFCRRDRRFKTKDPVTGRSCTVNKYITRTVHDLPISGHSCRIHIELAQVRTGDGERRIEECDFVEKGVRYSKRFSKQISGLCRHMPISVIAKHFGLRWETVKKYR